jgi:FkbM family methyltransferase
MGFFKNVLPSFVFNPINNLRRDYLGTPKKTYSGEGEDLIIQKLVGSKSNGFYVDVGCYHPKVGSNTYKLFKKGWRGINIDPNPETINLFEKHRKRDINLLLGVAGAEEVLRLHRFDEGALNTFSEEFKELRINQGADYRDCIDISVRPLRDIFDEYLPKGQDIDVLDIDVEGKDVEVLKSNNWVKYRPKIILIEDQ